MKSISIVGEKRGDRYFVVLSNDDGRRDEEEFASEEAAREAIRRMWKEIARREAEGVIEVTVHEDKIVG